MADLSQFLDQDLAEIKRPPTLPEGEYTLVILSKEFGQSNKKKTPQVTFNFQVSSAGDSVDQDELAQVDLSKVKLRETLYFTEDSLWRLKDFLEAAGSTSSTLREGIEEVIGNTIKAVVGHEVDTNDPEKKYVRLARFTRDE